MTPERYLAVLRSDGARLAEAARAAGLDAPIPSCPGWTVRECVLHTGEVFRNKARWLEIGLRPASDQFESEPPAGVGPIDWYDESLAVIVAALESRDPAAPADTWWPPDRTVGFWYRRMAQEVVVHRLDVEDALGAPTPVPDDVAVDGIDEVLHTFLDEDWATLTPEDWAGVDPEAGAGATILVRSGGGAWASTLAPDAIATVTLDPAHADGEADGGGGATATVEGAPESVLLWLWGRRPDAEVDLNGDLAAIRAFRARLMLATQ